MASNSAKAKAEKAAQDAALRKDYTDQLEAGRKGREDKLEQSVNHLGAQLEMVSEKYLTVNGFMQAMTALNDVGFGDTDLLAADGTRARARELAVSMSELASELAVKLSQTDVNTLGESFVDGLLDAAFVTQEHTTSEIAKQLLIINLLQNIGPVIDDIVQFREGVDAGIASIESALAELDEKPKLHVIPDELSTTKLTEVKN